MRTRQTPQLAGYFITLGTVSQARSELENRHGAETLVVPREACHARMSHTERMKGDSAFDSMVRPGAKVAVYFENTPGAARFRANSA